MVIASELQAVIIVKMQPDTTENDESEARVIVIGSPNVVRGALQKIGPVIEEVATHLSYNYNEELEN